MQADLQQLTEEKVTAMTTSEELSASIQELRKQHTEEIDQLQRQMRVSATLSLICSSNNLSAAVAGCTSCALHTI